MIPLKEFYSNFQINYFDYRVNYLQNALENISSIDVSNIIRSSTDSLKFAIKSDIRQNYFLALETLFTLIFSLCPDKTGKIDDKNILERIIKSKIPSKEVEEIASDEKGLDFLEKKIKNKIQIKSLGEYIFYYNVTDDELSERIPSSLDAIKYGLRVLARDFSDRREYNSYKHGFRIFPYMSNLSMSVSDIEAKENKEIWDLKDSLTFYSEEKGEISFITKVFDTQRDIHMTSLCSLFIWNIIKLRDSSFNTNEKVEILYFDKEVIIKSHQSNISIQDFTISIKK